MRSDLRRKSPATAWNSHEGLQKKVQDHITPACLIREITATITIGMFVSVVMWSCVFGMSGNMGPGDGVVVGPVAEGSDHE